MYICKERMKERLSTLILSLLIATTVENIRSESFPELLRILDVRDKNRKLITELLIKPEVHIN